jgi:release factor glutamine methyltransferase
VAAANAVSLGACRIRFRSGDWWQALDPDEARFDLVVSNPPYVAADDPHLSQGDLRFEPRHALAAGPAGDTDIRRIVAGAPARLQHGGWLAVEHGLEQGALCRHLMQACGFVEVLTHRDLEHRDRVTIGRTPDDGSHR